MTVVASGGRDEAGMTMKLAFDGDWRAMVTDDPLSITPRFTGSCVDIAHYANLKERERFLLATFGSQEWLWDVPDVLRFAPDSRKLAGAAFQMPYVTAYSETSDRVPVMPAVRQGGLCAVEVRDFRHEMCMVLCRAPGDAVLINVRDLDVLDEPLEACIGIAPDVALLVQRGAVVGWSLTDPARYLTTAYADPDPTPPSPATRRMLTECLDLMNTSVVDDLVDGEPAAVARFRAADETLRAQREDGHRADALLRQLALLNAFTAGLCSAPDFAHGWWQARRTSQAKGERALGALGDLFDQDFMILEDYSIEPHLAEPGDLDDDELRSAVRGARETFRRSGTDRSR
jgi:hypothetical protein